MSRSFPLNRVLADWVHGTKREEFTPKERALLANYKGKLKISECLPSFYDELTKIAARLSPAQANEMVGAHHENKDWKLFEKNLGNKGFRQAVLLHPESDNKLKRYTKTLGELKTSKSIVGVVPSRTSNKLHKIKELPGGRLGCDCKNWQYDHSHKKTDCAHIQELKGGLQ